MSRHAAAVPASDRVVEGGALALLVVTPLAFGTVQPWSEAIAILLVSVMTAAWLLGMVRNWEIRVELPPGWVPAVLFLGLLVLQVVPLPAWLVGLVSPLGGAAARATAGPLGGAPAWHTVSLAPYATWREGTKLLSVALLFLVLHNTVRRREQVDRLVWTMTVTGAAVALFGIVQRMTWNGHLYWLGPRAPHAEAFGPFVNRAHFAGLMVIVIPMALALWLSRSHESTWRRPERLRRWQDRLYAFTGGGAGGTQLLPFLVLLMGGAALVSRSRGGLVALVASLVVMVALVTTGRSGRTPAVKVAVVALLVVLAGLWIGADALQGTVERLADEVGGEGGGTRLGIWGNALGLWPGSPLVGTGLGSFGAVFPGVRTLRAPVAYTHAESDWVQLVTDTGLVGLALALATALLVARALLGRARHASHTRSRTLAQAALVVLAGAAVQAVGNIGMPVMSNLVYLAAAVAPAVRRAE